MWTSYKVGVSTSRAAIIKLHKIDQQYMLSMPLHGHVIGSIEAFLCGEGIS